MYEYNEFDKAFLESRAAQFRDQIGRRQRGELSEAAFRPLRRLRALRLQYAWYVQRYSPMLRVAREYDGREAAA